MALNDSSKGLEFNSWLGQCVVSLSKSLYLNLLQTIQLIMSSSVVEVTLADGCYFSMNSMEKCHLKININLEFHFLNQVMSLEIDVAYCQRQYRLPLTTWTGKWQHLCSLTVLLPVTFLISFLFFKAERGCFQEASNSV